MVFRDQSISDLREFPRCPVSRHQVFVGFMIVDKRLFSRIVDYHGTCPEGPLLFSGIAPSEVLADEAPS